MWGTYCSLVGLFYTILVLFTGRKLGKCIWRTWISSEYLKSLICIFTCTSKSHSFSAALKVTIYIQKPRLSISNFWTIFTCFIKGFMISIKIIQRRLQYRTVSPFQSKLSLSCFWRESREGKEGRLVCCLHLFSSSVSSTQY